MNRAPILVLMLLLVAGVGVLLVFSGNEPPLVRPDAPVTPAAAAGDPARAVPAPAAADVGTEVDEVELLPEDFLRAEVEAEATDGSLVIQVWRGKKGVPAPDAQVFLLDDLEQRGFDWDELKGEFTPHWSGVAEELGRRYRVDGDGRVEVPEVRGGAIVAAREPGAYGCAWVGEKRGAVQAVVLQPDETVTIRVVDGEGNPVAGAPVGVVQRVPFRGGREELFARMTELEQGMRKVQQWMEENPREREEAAEKMQAMRRELGRVRRAIGQADGGPRDGARRGDGAAARAAAERRRQEQEQKQKERELQTRPELRGGRRTGDDGLAVFEHFQLYRGKVEKWWPEDHRDRFEAVLLAPLQQPESRAFSGRPVPEEVIELRMPATGSIALRTVDRDGRPFTHPVHADLRIAGGESVPWSRLQLRKEQNEETLVFDFVGLGLRFSAHCRLDDNDFRWRAPEFAGPAAPGERVVVDLVVAPGEGMLFGRLFDAGGRPLGGEEITFLINGMAGRLEGEEVLLDEDGRFHLPYQMRPHHQPPFNLQIRRPGVVPVAGLSMPLPSLPREHVTDIGELRLDGLGVVAQGLVVDDRGEPIAGAWVQLHRERNVGREQVRLEFREEAFANAETDAEGRFALFGELANARYRLHVEADQHFDVWTPDLVRGEQQHVVLPRRSRLVGTLIRPDWLPPNAVRAELVLASDPNQRREDRIHDHKGRTYAYFDRVRPGVYDLTLRVSQFPEPFLRFDRLVVEPGQTGVHPRIRDVDLGAYLYRFEIFAVDEQGQGFRPRRPLLARIRRPDGGSGYVGFPWREGGRIEMFSTSPQTDVIPLAQGRVAETSTVAPGRNEIRFRGIPPVDVQLAGMRALAGTTNVQVVLEFVDNAGMPQQLEAFDGGSKRVAGWFARAKYTAALLGEDDVARVQLTRPGRHKVIARFGVRQGIRPTTVDLGTADIELQPGAGPQRVVVGYDLQPVQEAIAEAAQKIAEKAQGG